MVTGNYSISFRRIGDSILEITPIGNLIEFNADRVHAIYQKIYEQAFESDKHFVEIEDFSKVKGKPLRDERKKYIQLKKSFSKNLTGYFATNTSFSMRTIIKGVLLTSRKPPFEIKVFSNYQEAIKYGASFIKNEPKTEYSTVSIDDFISNESWVYTSIKRKYRGSFKIAKGFVLYVKHDGLEIMVDDVVAFEKIEEKLFREKHINQKRYFRIVDYSTMGPTPIRVRKRYASEMARIHTLFNVKAEKTYIVNPPLLTKTALLFVQKLVKMDFVFVKSLTEAINLMNHTIEHEHKQKKNRPKNITVTSQDLDILTEKIGTLVWDEIEGPHESFGEGHPFSQLVEAFDLVKHDYRSLNDEMVAKNEELEFLNTQLKVSLEKVNEMAMKAEHANIAKSAFLANMSHEIRTPLNGVIGMTDILLESELKNDQKDYIEIIKSSGSALLDLINDILDFSKIEAGRLEFENIDFDIRSAMDVVSDMLYLKAEEKDIEFGCVIDEDVPQYVVGDPARFRQCVINLANNAIKFTEQGHVIVQISLKEISDDGSLYLECSIEDTGIGIPENLHENIFDSFTQADASTTRQFGGTGLGTAITKQLVELMNGEIGFESTLGRGSTFWFTANLEQSEKKDPQILFDPVEMKHLKVLISDSSRITRLIYKNYLNSIGCEHVVESIGARGKEAVDSAIENSESFDIMIFDRNIIEQAGKDYCSTVKDSPGFEKSKCILCTTKTEKGDAVEMHKAGFDGYLSKPVKRHELLKTIELLISGTADDSGMVTRYDVRGLEEKSLMKILLVEDNTMNQKIATSMLKKAGYDDITIANEGNEAIQLFLKQPFDLILMDCQMPVMDGYETTRNIRLLDIPNNDIPIIALTANALIGDDDKCYKAGMNDYISKPMKMKVLRDTLTKWTVPKDTE